MKKLTILLFSMIIVVCLDYAISRLPLSANRDGYLFGFQNFYQTAMATKGQQRVILMGGSSLAWGVSAKRLSDELGMLVLNAGVHAGVGFRYFIRHIEDVVEKENDLIVISPEYAIVGVGHGFYRTKEFCEIAISVRADYPLECIGYALNKLAKIVVPVADRKNGDYFAQGFNHFGDYVFRQAGVNMVGKLKNYTTCTDFTLNDLSAEYIPYIKSLKVQGYRVVYIPNFIPETSCEKPELVQNFHDLLYQEFGVPGFESARLLFEDEYFYNTDYHLTRQGVEIKTGIFSDHLQQYLQQRYKNK